jgi:sulfate adenylyltransferase large subunit
MHGSIPFAAPGARRLLRVATAGSVDDGKSTLIGRLLLDAGLLPDDQLGALRADAARRGRAEPDLALITDGLSDERTQGITIDVAYRYVELPGRRLVLADVPGHEQYTRNMITGASTADAVVILVDARRGPTPQTWRHLAVALLMGIGEIVAVVNKMDLVEHSEAAFASIRDAVTRYAATFGRTRLRVVPVSARDGDNVVRPSEAMPWYDGQTLFDLLQSLPDAKADAAARPLRFPVQQMIRVEGMDRAPLRACLGRIASGVVAAGDRVVVLPGGRAAAVRSVEVLGRDAGFAAAPQSVALVLDRDLDVARGDMIAHADRAPYTTSAFDAVLFWLGRRPLDPRGRYLLRQTTRVVRARVAGLSAGIDVAAPARVGPPAILEENAIAVASIVTQSALAVDTYRADPVCGAFVLVDEATNETVAAGCIGDEAAAHL